jgi:hypothetical protein
MGKPPHERRGAAKHANHMVDVEGANLSSTAVEALIPTEANIREIRTRIEDVFNALGTDQFPGTIMPAGKSNNAKEAAEYVLADLLAKLATTRLKSAAEAAEKAGVFGNPEDYVIGDTVMVFSDPNFSVNVKMGKPSKMIKREKVEEAASEFLGKRSSEFLERCQGLRAPTKQIIVSMK